MAKKPIIRYFDRGVWYDATVSDIGNLEDLNTVHKTTVVEAINDIIGGNINVSGELLEKLTALDNNISRIDGLIASGSLNETQANQMNQFVTNKLNELNQSIEQLIALRDARISEQEQAIATLKTNSEESIRVINETKDLLNTTKDKLSAVELNVTTVNATIDEINGQIVQMVTRTDFDLLEGTVREQGTKITETAEGIKLLATKEELDLTNQNVNSVKSTLDVQAGLIESKVSSDQLVNEIEKIDKYMPNLLRYTRDWKTWTNDNEINITVTLDEYRNCNIQKIKSAGFGLSTIVEDLQIGETYSLSVWARHEDANAKLYAVVNNNEIVMTNLNSTEEFLGNEFKRMRCSFVASSNTETIKFIFKDCSTTSYGYLAGAKCEKSKKVSGWQPHSEDVYQSIKHNETAITQTDGKITNLVKTVEQQGELITTNSTKLTETNNTINLQAESIKTLGESIEANKAELKVQADKISSKVSRTDVGEMISDINIDNKNRVLNSDFGDGWELWSETNNLFQLKQIGNYKFAVAERSGLPQNMAIAIATNKFPVKHNERLMFGFYFYCADLSKLDNKIVCALELLDINDIRIDRVDFDVSNLSLENGSFTKLTNTYFVEDERIVKARLRFFLNRNGNVGFALPMAQGGDIKSSDWSLAPEDVARRFNDTNVTITNYEQTVDGFRQTVESYQGSVDGYTNQVSEFNQTVNGFSQTIKDYKESNDKRVQQLETSLTTESGKIEAVVKESAGTKDELGKLTANGGRISQLELTAQGLKSTVASQTSSIQTIQTDTTNAKQLANSAVSTANTAKSNADKAIADVASLTQTVSSQSTRIDQTSSRIDQVASGVTEVGNRLDSLSVGGRNLLHGTVDFVDVGSNYNSGRLIETAFSLTGEKYKGLAVRGKTNISGTYTASSYSFSNFNLAETYTFSFYAKGSIDKFRCYFYGDTGYVTASAIDTNIGWMPGIYNDGMVMYRKVSGSSKELLDSNIFKRYYVTWKLNNTGDTSVVKKILIRTDEATSGDLYICGEKMEIGNKNTDYSPSPEDNQSQIDGINNNIANNYYAKTTVDSKLSTAVSGITAQYTQDITTRLGNYYDKSTIDSKLTIDGQGIASYVKKTQNQLSSLQFSGRNYVLGSDKYIETKTGDTMRNFDFSDDILKARNKTFTVSIDIELENAVFTRVGFEPSLFFSNGNEKFYGTWLKYSGNPMTLKTRIFQTWTIADLDVTTYRQRGIYIQGFVSGRIKIGRPAMIEGDGTVWTPAPEDMATAEQAQQAQNDANEANSKADATEHRVSVAESTIKQLSDSISMMVTDSNGSSMMTQTSDGWTFNIGAITDAINSATNNIDNLSGSLSQTNNVVNNLNNLANDLSKKTAYINMTTDETGAPCIELGKTGNAFKVRITNTSVDFIEGSSKIAYVSNQALFIEKAIIKSELQVGEKRGFIWKTRSNGNMGLRWFG